MVCRGTAGKCRFVETMSKKLTPKQQLFVAAYRGNASEAARIAGYSCPMQQGQRLLMRNVEIARAIQARQSVELQSLVMSRHEREIWLSELIRDENQPTKHRLRALEILGRMQGDFIQRHEVRAGVNVQCQGLSTARFLQMLGDDD